MSSAGTNLSAALSMVQARSLREILSATRLLSLATVTPTGEAHVNTAFFSFTERFDLYLLSPTTTEHASNLVANSSAAATVFDSHQDATERRGVQLFGRLRPVDDADGDAALICFRSRFPDAAAEGSGYGAGVRAHGSALYVFRPDRVKIFDESLLSTGRYVEVRAALPALR